VEAAEVAAAVEAAGGGGSPLADGATEAADFFASLTLSAYFARVKSMQWVFLSLDLIGVSSVVAAVTSGIFFWQFVRQMKRLGD
jgi:hypothetical protein